MKLATNIFESHFVYFFARTLFETYQKFWNFWGKAKVLSIISKF